MIKNDNKLIRLIKIRIKKKYIKLVLKLINLSLDVIKNKFKVSKLNKAAIPSIKFSMDILLNFAKKIVIIIKTEKEKYTKFKYL